jgi:hypothetical protein
MNERMEWNAEKFCFPFCICWHRDIDMVNEIEPSSGGGNYPIGFTTSLIAKIGLV